MKNKNFTTNVVAFLRRSSVLLLAILFWTFQQNAFAQCSLSANDLVQVTLQSNCKAIITPQMILEGETPGCNYEITTIVDEAGSQVGKPDSIFNAGTGGLEQVNWVLDGNEYYYYETLMATVKIVGEPANSTMGRLYLEDKMAPTLNCIDNIEVACSEDLSAYLDTNTDAYYYRNVDKDMELSLGGGTESINDFPITVPPYGNLKIFFDVDNKAMQSEIIEYVVPYINKGNTQGLEIKLTDPSGTIVSSSDSPNPLEENSDNHFYGTQATDNNVNGVWELNIKNTSLFSPSDTLKSVILNIKSKKFTSSIGVKSVAYDNCRNDDLSIKILSDVTESNVADNCSEDYLTKRVIRYQAIDFEGNKSKVCEHVIKWKKVGLNDVDDDGNKRFQWPHNHDGQDLNPLSCTGHFMKKAGASGELSDSSKVWDTNNNSYPDPEEVGVPTIDGFPIYPTNGYCMLSVSFTDEKIDICPGSYKILRKWIAYDMCLPGGDDCCDDKENPRTHYQIIKVIDNTPPVLVTHFESEIYKYEADAFDCKADVKLPFPQVINDGCGAGWSYKVAYCTKGGGECKLTDDIFFEHSKNIDPLDKTDSTYTIRDLPVGYTCVRYYVKDDCGNESAGTLTVLVEDKAPPIPVCDEHTVATVTSDCTARIKAETFDDGSIDNCSDNLKFEVKKKGQSDSQYGEYVEYDRYDIGSNTLKVVLRVTDESGNSNTCEVDVFIDNKNEPSVVCPEYYGYISCDNIDPDAYYGSPIWDLDYCSPYDKIDSTTTTKLNNCGTGSLTKTWTITYKDNKKRSCTLVVDVVNDDPFSVSDIRWPTSPISIVGCGDADTSPTKDGTGEPDISADDACSMVAATYTDRVFDVVQGACYKILRDWTVIDWCQYDENYPSGDGIWRYTQVIKVYDTEEPVFTSGCGYEEVPAYNTDCSGDVEIIARADDCTPADELVWEYKVYNANNDLYAYGYDSIFKRNNVLVGRYKIHWTVEDKCGNFSECDMSLAVKDAKKPTPLCYSEITTVVMPSTDPKMVTVNARDFDRGSDDYCNRGASCGDCDTELKFSFSGTNPNDSTRTFTDADVGIQHLEMWVWDRAGNRDFCNVTLHVQDNATGTSQMVAGTVKTEDDKNVSSASVTVEDMDLHETVGANTDANGLYQVEVQSNSNYEVTADKDDNYLNGLTTLDIVLIQKHILGIKKIKSPYKLLAADVNMDGKLTSTDVLEIRKLILGKTKKFAKSRSWSFVNAGFEFDDEKQPWNDSDNGLYSIYLNNLSENTLENNFIGIKMGDINNTVQLDATSELLQPRGVKSLTMDNVSFSKGQEIEVPVYSSDFDNVNGFQMSLTANSDVLELVALESGAIKVSNNNYLIVGNNVNVSWNNMSVPTAFGEETMLFTLRLKAKQDGQLINQLEMGTRIKAEAYNEELDVYSVGLDYRNDVSQFVLYQNTPNPFSNETDISFEIPKRGIVTISIYDVAGKELVNISREFEEGYNSVIVSKEDLNEVSGVLYYKVESDGNSIIKKMVVISE